MRKLTKKGFNFILISGIILFCGFLIFWFQYESGDRMEPGDGQLQAFDIKEKIIVEFLSVNYLEDTEFLIRVAVGGEQVGVVYFDENGEIRFDGDKEKFEDAIFKAFDARRVK